MKDNRPKWHEIQELMQRGMKLEDMNLSVAYYGRVSTDKEYQLHSLENTNEYLEKYINGVQNWTLYKGYVDEGISGTRADKRDSFLKMIEDAKMGRFSLIITKEVCRFARNTRECLNYIQLLKENNVGIMFTNDNIITFRSSDNFSLNIRGVVAEEESRNTSQRVSFGHQQSINKGVVFGNGRIYGYDKIPGALAINEEEAKMVRMIFDMYVKKDMSLHQIELELERLGYTNHSGKRISHVTISHIIANPKYKGYYVGNKVKIIDMQSKKQKFLDQSEWKIYKDETGEIVPQIVDEQLWDLAYAKYTQRKKQFKEIRQNNALPSIGWGRSPLSGKIICEHCNAPFWRDVVSDGANKGKEYWRCSVRKNNGSNSCPSAPIYLEEILEMVRLSLADLKDALAHNAKEYIRILSKEMKSLPNNAEKEIKSLKVQYDQLDKKRDKLLDHNLEGRITDEQFADRNAKLTDEMKKIKNAISDAEEKALDQKNALKRIDDFIQNVSNFLAEYKGESLSVDAAAKIIDTMTIHPVVDGEAKVELKLYLSDEMQRFKVKTTNRRYGNMVKTVLLERRVRISRKGVKPFQYRIELSI